MAHTPGPIDAALAAMTRAQLIAVLRQVPQHRHTSELHADDAGLRRGILIYHRMGRLTASQITGGKP